MGITRASIRHCHGAACLLGLQSMKPIHRLLTLTLGVALVLLTGYAHAVTVPTTNQYQDIGWNYGLGTATTAVPGPGTPGMTAGQVFAAGIAALQSFVPSNGYVFDHLQFLPDVGGSGFGTTAAGITAGFDCNSGAGRCYISAIYKKTGFSNMTGFATFSINGCPTGTAYFTDGTFTGCKTTAAACPPNSTLSGGSCTCDSGYGVDSTGKYCVGATCTATTNPIGGPGTAGYLFPVGAVNKVPSMKVCISGCTAYFNGSSSQAADAKLVGGVVQNYAYGYYQFSGLGTGDQCSVGIAGSAYKSAGVGTATVVAPTGSPTAVANTCPTGQYSATVNGATNCYTAAGQMVPTTAPQDTTTITNKTTQDAAGNTTVCSTSTNNQTQVASTNCSTYAPGVTPPTVPLSQTISTPGSANGGQTPLLISGSFSGGSGSSTGSSSTTPTYTAEATPGQDMSAFCTANPNANACHTTSSGTAATVGTIYTADTSGKTFSGSLTNAKTTIQASGWYGGMSSMFGGTITPGNCDSMNTTFSLYTHSWTIDLSFLCSSQMATFYSYLYGPILVGAVMAAFAIAFL